MSKFNEKTPALDVVKGIELKGFDVIVIGASTGIGIEKGLALAQGHDAIYGRSLFNCAEIFVKRETMKNLFLMVSQRRHTFLVSLTKRFASVGIVSNVVMHGVSWTKKS